jgi:hypothetical protein
MPLLDLLYQLTAIKDHRILLVYCLAHPLFVQRHPQQIKKALLKYSTDPEKFFKHDVNEFKM